MTKITPSASSALSAEEPLANYYKRLLYPIAVAGSVLVSPFVINNFIQGRYLLGSAILLVALCLGIDAWAMRYDRRAPIPHALLVIPIMMTMSISLREQGVIGAFWAFPAVVLCFFVLSKRMANICSSAFVLLFSWEIAYYIEVSVATRFFVSLLLMVIIINLRVTYVAELQSKLLEQSITDPLTHAFNRRHMDTCLREAIYRNSRNGTPASILILDIDHFKHINDVHGHEKGDAVLQHVVKLVSDRARSLDRLFRMGGEEFLLLLPDTHIDGAVTVAETLRVLIAGSGMLDDREVTVSIGVAELRPGQSSDAWLKQADDALYKAKESGRNRVMREEPAMITA